MENKKHTFKTSFITITTGVLTTLISTFLIANFNGCFDNTGLSKEERNKKIFKTLEAYSADLNKKAFDAYKYFTPKVERFFQMFDTSPKKINDYVNGSFYDQFQNASTRFEEGTLIVNEIDEGFQVIVIAYSTYYDAAKKKQFTNFRTKTELKFDNDFRIKYFRQFFD